MLQGHEPPPRLPPLFAIEWVDRPRWGWWGVGDQLAPLAHAGNVCFAPPSHFYPPAKRSTHHDQASLPPASHARHVRTSITCSFVLVREHEKARLAGRSIWRRLDKLHRVQTIAQPRMKRHRRSATRTRDLPKDLARRTVPWQLNRPAVASGPMEPIPPLALSWHSAGTQLNGWLCTALPTSISGDSISRSLPTSGVGSASRQLRYRVQMSGQPSDWLENFFAQCLPQDLP